MPYIWKVLWSRRKRRKQNKLFSIKYQSYHRHHLIRISSCHTLQRAKKTKKTKILLKQKQKSNRKDQPPSRFIHLSHRRSEFKLKMSHCNIHPILLESGAPSHKNCSMWKKRAMQDTLLISEKPLLLLSYRGKKKNLYIANFYVTRNIILQSASCFQHFCCQI